MSPPRRVLRGSVAILAVVAVSQAIAPSVAAAASDPVAAAEATVTAAQQQADAAAAAYDRATAKYYQLDEDAQRTRATIKSLTTTTHGLVSAVQARAVSLYEQGPLQNGFIGDGHDVLAAGRRSILVAAANANADAAVARLGALSQDLHLRESTLRTELAAQHQTLTQLDAQQVVVRHALADAQQAVQDLRVRLEREQRQREFSAILERARSRADASSGGSQDTAPSSDESAGQIIVTGTWVCPVQGAISFTDTFGAPRGNGRTHHGVDIFAASGTPVVAVVSGQMFFQADTLGGQAAYVTGSDGTTYYYAHLSDYVGGNRTVSAGELIGHVGNTGDAEDAPPQLHFEIRPGGPNGIAIDPYPTVRAHC